MPEEGEYLLSHVGFSRNEKPVLVLQKDAALVDFMPLGHTFTLKFDTTERFCTGWHDLATGENFTCPDRSATNGNYEQCPSCQKRTGFNPAFYHATNVSAQQEARNAEPHILYLAHFATGTVKVGISYAGRGNSRLLEQGARSALVLETFPTANIARQYEAKIAALPGIAETMLISKKIAAFKRPYDTTKAKSELEQTRSHIEQELKTSFDNATHFTFDGIYFPDSTPELDMAHNTADDDLISGRCTGMLGSLLFCEYDGTPVFLPAKKYTGYRVALSHDVTPIELPAQQISLF